MQENEGEQRIPVPAHIMQRCIYRLVDVLNYDPRNGCYRISKNKQDTLQVHWITVKRPRIWSAWWYRLTKRQPVRKWLAFEAVVSDGVMQLVIPNDFFDQYKFGHLMTSVLQHVMEQDEETESGT